MKTKVMFLYHKENDDLFAWFPYTLYTTTDELLAECYTHVGQHGAVHDDYVDECIFATPEQYDDLRNELENIVGYELEILNN
jgi:hypothetical protein